MPCNCLLNKCMICYELNKNLIKEYHKIDLNNFNIDDYITEFIQRLNYEIIFGYLEKKTLLDNTFLINDQINCKRDTGHNTWLIEIILILIQNKVIINGLNLELAYNNYKKYKLKLNKNIMKNEYNEWSQYIIDKVDEDVYNVCEYISKNTDNNILWTDDLYIDKNYLLTNPIKDFYNEPKFNLKNKNYIYDDLINLYYQKFSNNIYDYCNKYY